MEKMQLIFGNDFVLIDWAYSLFLGFLGFFLLKLVLFNRRTDKTSTFNPVYWWKDNRVEMFIGFIMFYIVMRFHQDVMSLVTENFNVPLINNKHFLVFVIGLFFQIIIKKGRAVLGFRNSNYENGQPRDFAIADQPNPDHEEH